MKHIPTLTLIHYKEGYSYRYDDAQGNTQEEGTFLTLKDCIGSAALHLRTFTLIEGIEEA